ncbi:MAG: sodium:proton antiporter [Gammaproteobacteria bacterium]
MSLFGIMAVLLTLSAAFSYLNYRYFELPTTIGIMLSALMFSLALILLGHFGRPMGAWARQLLARIDFNRTLLHGMLSFLLFAGSLRVNINDLAREKWIVALLALGGVVVSTAIVGLMAWWLLGLLGFHLPLMYGLLFGALISPTDPVAVLGIVKSAGASEVLETRISGESLFNDGVGVVLFVILLQITVGGGAPTVTQVTELFLREALGGALFGLVIGGIAYLLLKSVDDYHVEILITLALVAGGYHLADHLGLSGPIAIVVAGLLIGNHGRALAMSDRTREHLDSFWELVDEIMNAVLFLLIGLEVLQIAMPASFITAGALMIPVVLLARLVSVGIPVALTEAPCRSTLQVINVLTWGGLRGGIAVALALSLPPGHQRDLIITMTYAVVVFSIVVQGLTIGPLIARSTAID